jgi:hypothetical protein
VSEPRCRFPLRCPCSGCRRFATVSPENAKAAFDERWKELADADRAALAFLDAADGDPDGDW